MKLFLFSIISLLSTTVWAGEVANAVKDIKLVTPYMWEIAAFFAMLGSLRVTQWVKKIQWFPVAICNLKTTKDGKRQYWKLKKKYLIAFSTLLSFGLITLCLSKRYPDIQEVMIIAGIAALSQFTILELLFTIIDKKSPGASDILSHGLYVPDEDATVYTKFVQAVVGNGEKKK